MNTTEAKRVEALRKRRLMRTRAQILADKEVSSSSGDMQSLARDVLELLDERREMAETIRQQRVLLSEVEKVLVAVDRGYQNVRNRLREAVTDD